MRGALWAVLALIATLPAVAEEVRFELPSDLELPVATVELEALGAEAEEARQLVLTQGVGVIDLAAGTHWRARLSTAGWWAPPVILTEVEGGEVVRLKARRTGRLQGQIQVPRGHPVPGELRIRFEDTLPADTRFGDPSPRVGERFETVCPVADGGFDCEVPAGSLDLRLRARGFVSHYLWSQDIVVDKALELGALQLRPGASLVGWIGLPSTLARDFSFQDVEVVLRPELPATASPRELQQRAGLIQRGQVSARGFMTFEGVPPGSYVLMASAPGLRGRMGPLTIYAGTEAEIHQLELNQMARLRVSVVPPRSPFRGPWQIELARMGEIPNSRDEVASQATDEGGMVLFEELTPAEYAVVVKDPLQRRWAMDRVWVGNADEHHQIELPIERLEVRVRVGEEPLAGARVLLTSIGEGGRGGGEQISETTNAEGQVFLFVPIRDAWRVRVESDQPSVAATRRVEVPEPEDGEPWARVELELPANTLEGRVVREDRGPVQGARLRVMARGDDAQEGELRFVRTEPDGTFELKGLSERTHLVEAHLETGEGTWSSTTARMEVTEGENGPIELVLRRARVLEGQVYGPGGVPVPGAQVSAQSLKPGLVLKTPITHTGASGEFTLHLTGEGDEVALTVQGPGYAIQQFGPVEPDQDALLLEVDQDGGTLLVSGLPTEYPPTKERPVLFGPFQLGPYFLLPWVNAYGGRVELSGDPGLIEIPRLAPGLYHLCTGPGVGQLTEAPQGNPLYRCTSGALSPFGTLELETPPPQSE